MLSIFLSNCSFCFKTGVVLVRTSTTAGSQVQISSSKRCMYVRATGIAGEVTRIAKRRGVCAACIPIGERWWEPRRGRDGRTDWTGTGIIKTERKRQQVSQARHPTAEEKKGKEGRRGKASASCPFLFLLLLLLSPAAQPSAQDSPRIVLDPIRYYDSRSPKIKGRRRRKKGSYRRLSCCFFFFLNWLGM